MDAARTGRVTHWGLTSFYEENKAFVKRTLKHVEKNGPTTSRELSTRTEKKGTWWDWDEAKVALEYLFLTGELMSRGRGTDFARIYDIPERVLPQRILNAPTPSEHDARKQLLVRSAIAQGVATASDLADYYRQKLATVKPLIYYVLPFMMNGEMVGRVDLKADRANGVLQAHSVHAEKGVKRSSINEALNAELDAMATWLGLEQVQIGRR